MIVDIYKMHIKETNIKSRVFNYYFDYLRREFETKNILINQKKYKHLVIYFTRYDCGKSIRMLSLGYHESMEKVEEHEGANT